MTKAMHLPYPPRWINAYLFDKLSEYEDIGISATQQVTPIFATSPTNTEEIYKQVIETTNISQPLLIQYDRLMRYRPNSFYPIKREQLLYYLYSTSIENVNNANIAISQILDREDAAAQDVNAWAASNPQYVGNTQIPHNVFFHNIKVYQADEARDVLDLASARTIFVNKLIIEYDYHAQDGSTIR